MTNPNIVELMLGFGKEESGVDVLMEMIEHVYEWRDHMAEGVEIANRASARLLITCKALLTSQEGA